MNDLFLQIESDIHGVYTDGPKRATRVAQVRNYYAHYFKDSPEKKPRSLEELYELTRFARVLLVGHFMRELGVPSTSIHSMAKYWAGFTTHVLAGYDP